MSHEASPSSEKFLRKADETLVSIGKEIQRLKYISPLNDQHGEEKAKFLADASYHPQFLYEPFETAPFETQLHSVVLPREHPLSSFYQETKKHITLRLASLKYRGTTEFTQPLYEPVTGETEEKAQRILEAIHPSVREGDKREFDAQDIVNFLTTELKRHGDPSLRAYRVFIDPSVSSRADIDSKAQEIKIRPDATASDRKNLEKLWMHEVQTHAFRGINGEKQEYKIFNTEIVPGYLACEEGLAMVNEVLTDTITLRIFRQIAGRVIAVSFGQKHSFRETYNELVQRYNFTERWSYLTVKRVKRGLGDTSNPGGFLKDHLYFQGFLQVGTYLLHGGRYRDLYAGKIGLHHVPFVQNGVLKPATLLPSFYKTEKQIHELLKEKVNTYPLNLLFEMS